MVEQKLDELKSEYGVSEKCPNKRMNCHTNWGFFKDENDLFLPICLYCIEKEFNFTSDGLFAGLQKHTFSKEMEEEIMKYCEERNEGKKIEERQIRQNQAHPQFKATNSFHRTSG